MKASKNNFFILLISSLLVLPLQAQQISVDHYLPIPETASPAMQAVIANGQMPYWNKHFHSSREWKDWVAEMAKEVTKERPELREKCR